MQIDRAGIYRLMTACLLSREHLHKILYTRAEILMRQGKCIGQASKLKLKRIILSKFFPAEIILRYTNDSHVGGGK